METFQARLAQQLASALVAVDLPSEVAEVTPASDPRFGDYQSNAAMVLAKQRREKPRDIAQQIVEAFVPNDLFGTPTIAGAGFINFTIRSEAVAAKTSALLRDDRLGVARAESPKKIVIDFSSPNVAKPMHIGHIRSTVIGDALARIAEFLGHDVIRDNHIGDWGTQFGMVIWGWKNLLDRDALARDPIVELVRIYKETNARGNDDPAIREKCKEELVKLQAHEPENHAIWKQCVDLSLGEFARTYELLDIRHDIQCGESFYNDRLAGVVERLLAAGIAEESEGAIVVFFRDIPELADKPIIVRKKDGGYNYATSDVATVDYRVVDLKRDTCWYVVGAPQTLHFRQIFEIARREGYTADLRHIPFGNILGEDRKLMKTRAGESVPLREVLDEAIERARRIVEEKNPDVPVPEKLEIARKIGLGAVKYADLSQYRMTDYVFSWDKMLSLHGNTAPYLQNAYVRIQSIFRKAGSPSPQPSPEGRGSSTSTPRVNGDGDGPFSPGEKVRMRGSENAIQLTEPAELVLAKRLCQFAEIVPTILNDFRPNILANYLFELANSFHAFYEACPVLKSEEPARSSRLALCQLTARTLQRGLQLLGIEVPERM